MGPKELKAVLMFHKKAKLVARGYEEPDEEMDSMQEFWMLWSTPFKPNLMNTVIFLVETSQIIAVLFVNYKGRPVVAV